MSKGSEVEMGWSLKTFYHFECLSHELVVTFHRRKNNNTPFQLQRNRSSIFFLDTMYN